ncbi:hypothetical protein F4780DRAFT_31393 [Xylariomycetidae sp. FL0641]|nr:hypothetical protein F4780DRAFT_31393 [Xylariomycetidae sp. FL0641]
MQCETLDLMFICDVCRGTDSKGPKSDANGKWQELKPREKDEYITHYASLAGDYASLVGITCISHLQRWIDGRAVLGILNVRKKCMGADSTPANRSLEPIKIIVRCVSHHGGGRVLQEGGSQVHPGLLPDLRKRLVLFRHHLHSMWSMTPANSTEHARETDCRGCEMESVAYACLDCQVPWLEVAPGVWNPVKSAWNLEGKSCGGHPDKTREPDDEVYPMRIRMNCANLSVVRKVVPAPCHRHVNIPSSRTPALLEPRTNLTAPPHGPAYCLFDKEARKFLMSFPSFEHIPTPRSRREAQPE